MKNQIENIKIIFIDQYNKMGGGQSVLIELMNTCTQLGHTVSLAIPKGENYVEKNIETKSIHYLEDYPLNNNSKNIFDIFLLVVTFLKNVSLYKKISQNDYIYVNGPRYFMFAYFFSILFKKKYIYHIHLDYNKYIKHFLLFLLKSDSTYKIVFTSNFVMNKFKVETKLNEKYTNKTVVIEPCILQKYENIDFVNRFSTNNFNYNFISFGRIIPEKGFDRILEIARIFKNYTFYIVGSPEYDSIGYYQKLLNNKTQNVIFIDKTDNILNIINNFNIQFAIIPSIWEEPFGIVAIESMCFSCITLLSSKGGLIEIAENTNAISFNTTKELIEHINSLKNKNLSELSDTAYNQFLKTQNKYKKEQFVSKVKNVFYSVS